MDLKTIPKFDKIAVKSNNQPLKKLFKSLLLPFFVECAEKKTLPNKFKRKRIEEN